MLDIPSNKIAKIPNSMKSSMFSKILSIFYKFLGAEAPSLSVRGRGETDYI